ncbi:SAM-dependent methyltransferase [Paractinoplanes rishiriensis]|uniref:SAM-dependent methyltransferase n=1 Tax=Paractinoplanes rishiriensis TaxID=1050105 RepID=UPI0023B23D29|nr:SAM-dependent methyltransferase [Actinoplanes rishiriensis]
MGPARRLRSRPVRRAGSLGPARRPRAWRAGLQPAPTDRPGPIWSICCHPAYWLGGVHRHPVDVAAARAFESAYGPCALLFRSLRAFSGRAVRHAASDGIDPFLGRQSSPGCRPFRLLDTHRPRHRAGRPLAAGRRRRGRGGRLWGGVAVKSGSLDSAED